MDHGIGRYPPPHKSTSFVDLDYDILLLIFEQINITDAAYTIKEHNPSKSNTHLRKLPKLYYYIRKTLPILRLVSSKFKAAVTPIRYRNFKLKTVDLENGIASFVISDVVRYTRNVVFNGHVDWDVVSTTYQSLPRLETIKWLLHGAAGGDANAAWRPVPLNIARPNVKISVELSSHCPSLNGVIPPSQLVSLDLGYWQPKRTTLDESHAVNVATLKSSLLANTNLKVLRYTAEDADMHIFGGDCIPFPTFTRNQKVPAFRELTIPSYQWNHSTAEVELSWNFKELRYLDIRGVPLYPFFSSINFSDFGNLRVLKIGDFSWSRSEDLRAQGVSLLEEFLLTVPNLEEFYMTSWRTGELTQGAMEVLSYLKVLEFRETILIGEEPENDAGSVFDIAGLEKLGKWHPFLEELAVEIDPKSDEFLPYLKTLTEFPKLQNITLYTKLRSWDALPEEPGQQRRKPNASYTMFQNASDNLVGDIFPKIVINVGCWHAVTGSRAPDQVGNKQWVSERVFKWEKVAGERNTGRSGSQKKIGN